MNFPPGTDPAILRDGACVIGGSMVLLCPHHIIHTGAGGPDTLENKVTLCLEHHTQVHAGYMVLHTCIPIRNIISMPAEHILRHRDEIDELLRAKVKEAMEDMEMTEEAMRDRGEAPH